VRSHFTERGERWLTRRIHHIETHETAGELGAIIWARKAAHVLRVEEEQPEDFCSRVFQQVVLHLV
jgi:hypothetical protein